MEGLGEQKKYKNFSLRFVAIHLILYIDEFYELTAFLPSV